MRPAPSASTTLVALVTALGAAALLSNVACGSSGSAGAGDAGETLDGATDTTSAAAGVSDAGGVPTAPDSSSAVASRCLVTKASVSCTHVVTRLVAGMAARDVYWQTPATPAPPGGYPVVVLYQGSVLGPSLTWGVLTPSAAFGGFHQGRLQAMLLDSGFTVIAPEAAAGFAWQTNSTVPYELSTDKGVVDALLAAIEDGQFGPANMTRLYATGISSGGYMTSRMAVSYRGRFRALAIQSASYATCLGPVCVVPSTLPDDHPPTLFLHGALDTTVPLSTAERYHEKLIDSGFDTNKIVDPAAGHEWLDVSPARITEWFMTH